MDISAESIKRFNDPLVILVHFFIFTLARTTCTRQNVDLPRADIY
jgi:hypothetical protein